MRFWPFTAQIRERVEKLRITVREPEKKRQIETALVGGRRLE
jgi:hypothetical protein